MTLQVRRFSEVTGLPMLVICDEHGVMLPGQMRTKYESEPSKVPELTVAFGIIGDDVVLVDGEAIIDRPPKQLGCIDSREV
jgi:hypothetical protein